MFRNQYDSDVTTWSPQGRLYQVEYAMEAVKQGSATVGVKSSRYAVLVALKRASSELSAHQKKIMYLDGHMGMSIAGLTADAKSLSRWMRTECLHARYFNNAALRLGNLIYDLGNKMQLCIQGYNKRPYGVGLLVAGYDDLGPHIYHVCPSANYYDCKAMAIGARSQSAKTYLEKHLDSFPESDLDALVAHGLRALRDTLPNEVDLTNKVRGVWPTLHLMNVTMTVTSRRVYLSFLMTIAMSALRLFCSDVLLHQFVIVLAIAESWH